MSSTTISSIISSTSPCSPDQVTVSPGDCVESGVEQFLEDEAVGGFRVWQLAGIVLSFVLMIIIGLCCCIRFRVPRTKENIEADFIRKRLTKNFRKELSKISNNDMDEMDLKKALDKVKELLDTEEGDLEKHIAVGEQINADESKVTSAFHQVFKGMRTRLSKKPPSSIDNPI